MENFIPIIFASLIGLAHAFDADHLLAVSSIAARRDNTLLAIKDGVFWGLGHTTTIVIVGTIIMTGRLTFLDFDFFEVFVGIVLIGLGVSRIASKKNYYILSNNYKHSAAYSVGLLHGLAGSGALIILVMSEFDQISYALLYLLVFGFGSILGMLIVVGMLRIPFTRRMKFSKKIKFSIEMIVSFLCIAYGSRIIYQILMV